MELAPRKTPRIANWSGRYGKRHRLDRVMEFPGGIAPPAKVRIYRRTEHFVLQWWDPHAKNNLSDRVDGDLIDAIARARDIDQRLVNFRRSGHSRRRLTHPELVESYLEDLHRRAVAGEIALATSSRYEAALAHYLAFANQPAGVAKYRYALAVDRQFVLELVGYLNARETARNGHSHAAKHRMQSGDFVLDTVRAMYLWAADPDRGNRLPEGFRNPFVRNENTRTVALDMAAAPDITASMAAEFLAACDNYALRLFAPYVFCGLRAAEPVYLFREFVDADWLNVPCIPGLSYVTKGRRNKRVPLLPEIKGMLLNGSPGGLIYLRRAVVAGAEKSPLLGASLAELTAVYEKRRRTVGGDPRAAEKIRDTLLSQAGATTYDAIQGEFRRIARTLGWPAAATLKDFRHLFSTAVANGGMPEHERRYLMGHAPGREAIVRYTHLDKLAEHYQHAVEQELGPVLTVVRGRQTESAFS